MKTLFFLLFFSTILSGQVYYSSEWYDNQSYISDARTRHSFINGYYIKDIYSSDFRYIKTLKFKIYSFEIDKYDCYSFVTYITPTEIIESYSSGLVKKFKRD